MTSLYNDVKKVHESIKEACVNGWYEDDDDNFKSIQFGVVYTRREFLSYDDFFKLCRNAYKAGTLAYKENPNDLSFIPILFRFDMNAQNYFREKIHSIFNTTYFTISHWNILADELAKDFIDVDEKDLLWKNRFSLIKPKLAQDIICLVEVSESKYPCMRGYLKSKGYKSAFHLKAGEDSKDGCAIFWNDKFEFKEDKCIPLLGSQIAFFVTLTQKLTNKTFTVVSTHLKHTKTEEGELFRLKQVNLLLSHINPETPYILTGDMNSEPQESSMGPPLVYDRITVQFEDSGGDYITTWKKRVGGIQKRTEDYIFFNRHISFVSSTIYNSAILPIPSSLHPSDHYQLETEFTLV